MPMPLTGIYAITDDKLQDPEQLPAAVEAALQGGISLLQYRAKTGSFDERQRTAATLQSLCDKYHVPLLINDDISLCQAVGAAGVHVGTQDASIAQAREILGINAIIGATCHDSLELAIAAQHAGASYVAFGRFFPSRTKPTASPADLALLSHARKAVSLPIVAIGGINAENGAAVRAAGADMLAVVHGIFGADDIYTNTAALVRVFSSQDND